MKEKNSERKDRFETKTHEINKNRTPDFIESARESTNVTYSMLTPSSPWLSGILLSNKGKSKGAA